jgi:Ca-activated chloride channel homolog
MMDFWIHWIRPHAFWLLLMLVPILWFGKRARTSEGHWADVVDPHLLPYLLVGVQRTSTVWWSFFVGLGWIIFVIALAGPSWHQVPTPVFKKEQALVIVLDCSPTMLATDIKPSRIARAKYKLMDLLKTRKEGQTALVVFSAEPYVVAPLTQDSQTIINLLPALSPELMPAVGQRIDLALSQAAQLIKQTGAQGGEILLITGGLSEKEALENQLRDLKSQGISTTIYGVGTSAGSPISLPRGGFLRDEQGNIFMTHLDAERLLVLAKAGGGSFVKMTLNNDDIKVLNQVLEPAVPWQKNPEHSELDLTLWRDEGHWVVILLLPLFLLGLFRRGRNGISL